MSKPEKDDKKEQEPIEIFADIDDYQKRMESQWESSRSSYQKKIDDILHDFLDQAKKDGVDLEDSKEKRAVSKYFNSDSRVDSIFSQAENALKAIEKKARELTGKTEKSRVINIDWATDRPASNRNGIVYAVAGMVTAAVLGFYFTTAPSRSILPYTHTAAVVVQDNKIYIADWFRHSIYVHKASRNLPIVEVESIPNDFLTGYAVGPNQVWSANGVTAQIFEHAKGIEHAVSREAQSPGKSPAGLVFDGTDLWSIDNDSKKLTRFRGTDFEEVKDEYQMPQMEISGLAMSDNRVYVLSKKSREISEFRLGDPVKIIGSYDLDSFLKGATPTGLYMDGSTAWLTTENPPQLLKLSKRSLISHRSDTSKN